MTTAETARILTEAANAAERTVRCQTHAEANGKRNTIDFLRQRAAEAPATSNPSVTTDRVLSEVLAERIRQDDKWGEQNWHDFEGISILTEEVGEAAQAANEANFTSGSRRGDYTQLRAELVQVAAVAVHHIEVIDRRPGAHPAPVLPPTALARMDALREIADICDEAGAVYASKGLDGHAEAAFTLMERLLRKVNEAEYVATPCDTVACEPGGEPCGIHERLMAHAEGDHELCEPDCGLRAAVEAQQ